KHGVAFYGYKLHASTDRRWGFIRRYDVSAANVHDSRHFEQVLDPDNTGRTVWADSGYADAARESDLKRRGYRPAIQHQGHARKPLSEAAKRRNRRIAKDRVFGEHPFARLAQQGGKFVRCIGLARAKVVIGLKVASHNVMRLARLQERAM
ncbi:transposase, partial [Xanthomonas sp. LF06-19]